MLGVILETENVKREDIFTLHVFLVGVSGLEPLTPASQTRCATNCATPRVP